MNDQIKSRIVRKYLRKPDPTRPNAKGDPRGVACATVKDGLIWYGFAICHKNDRFAYKTSNRIALGRMECGRYTLPLSVFEADPHRATELVTKSLKNHVKPLAECVSFALAEAYQKHQWDTTHPREVNS